MTEGGSGAATFAAGWSEEVLEAFASRGLLRRARRDAESGLAGEPQAEGAGWLVPCDGESVRFPTPALAQAQCSCPATGPCRHILAAALRLRDAEPAGGARDAPEADEPARADIAAEIRAIGRDGIARTFGRAALVRAEALLANLSPGEAVAEPVAGALRLRLGEHPEILVPTGAGAAGLVSRAQGQERAVLHAAALLFSIEPGLVGSGPDPASTAPARHAAALGPVLAALEEAAGQILAAASPTCEERLADLALSSRVEAMPRLSAELRALARALRHRRERREEETPRLVLSRLARTHALASALERRPGEPALTGAEPAEPTPLEDSDFIGCGLETWASAAGRGVRLHALRRGDGAAFSLALARGVGTDPGFSPQSAARGEAVLGGQTLERLASAGWHLAGGSARLDRVQTASGTARLAHCSWREIADGLDPPPHRGWQRLGDVLRQAPDRGLAAGLAARPVILAPERIAPPRFDAVAQRAAIALMDSDDGWLDLHVAASDQGFERWIEAFDRASREKAAPLVCALVRLDEGALRLSPSGIEHEGRLVMPALDPVRSAAQPQQSFLGKWAQRIGERIAARGERALQFSALPSDEAGTAGRRLAFAALDEIVSLAELGGRMEDPERLARLEALGGQLRLAGLARLAGLVEALAAAARPERPRRLLRAAYALDLFLNIEPALPLVAPPK